MPIEFVVSELLPANPQEVYDAWLSSVEHTNMTGSPASIQARVGSEFSAWDGYIHGKNLELENGRRIIQTWRTSEFKDDEPDSKIEVTFEPIGDQTKVTLRHTRLPPHGTQYEQGWQESYFEPMKEYFNSKRST